MISSQLKTHQRVRAVHVIEHVFYPDFPPDEHAGQLVAWLRANPA